MRSALILFLCAGAFAATPVKLLQTVPIQFEHNGQTWSARGLGYAFRFEPSGTAMRLGDRTLSTTLLGADAAASFTGLEQGAHPSNIFRGGSYQRVENFARLLRKGVYPGIDLIYYSRNGELEYDFEVAPGADPKQIALRIDGADSLRLNARGDLVAALDGRELIQHAPEIYQRGLNGALESVHGSYVLKGNTARFELGDYDPTRTLVIDPSVAYVAFLSGSDSDKGVSVAHDSSGNIYLGGYTYSPDFPLGGIGFSTTPAGNVDCYVLKLNPTAADPTQTIAYASYFGGSQNDILTSMRVSDAGLIYFTGYTNSTNFPVSGSAYTSVPAAPFQHGFVTVLDSTQDSIYSEIYSSYLGGTTANDYGQAIYASNGFFYVCGYTQSTDFPTAGGFQGTNAGGEDAFVAKFDPTQQGLASLVFSTYLGGGGQDRCYDIAADQNGLIYVTGSTFSTDIGYTSNAYNGYSGSGDAFFAVIDPNQSAITYLTAFGGGTGFDEARHMVVDPAGKTVAIAGYTLSTDMPVTQNAYQPVMPSLSNIDSFGNQMTSNGFLAVFDMTQTNGNFQGLKYATYFGGYGGEAVFGLATDSAGRYYLGGYTLSFNFPVTSNAFNPSTVGGGLSGFVSVLDLTKTSQLVYSSYVTGTGTQSVYGIDVDASGKVWITGTATGSIFPSGFETFPLNPNTGLAQSGKQASYVWGFSIQ